MEWQGFNVEDELEVFKTMVLISSTKISKKTPGQYLKFQAQLQGPYQRLFEKANIQDIKAFLKDPFGRRIYEQFISSGALKLLEDSLLPQERDSWLAFKQKIETW